MQVTIKVPAVQGGLLASNLLGAAGLLGIALAIGALAGNWWWSVLVGGVFAVGLAYVAALHAQQAAVNAADPEHVDHVPRGLKVAA